MPLKTTRIFWSSTPVRLKTKKVNTLPMAGVCSAWLLWILLWKRRLPKCMIMSTRLPSTKSFIAMILEGNKEMRDMKKSLMLYVHIPFCMQKCRYCDFLSAPWGQAERQAYCEALLQEIRAWKGKRLEPVTSVFIGGGTPSLLEPSYICALLQPCKIAFRSRRRQSKRWKPSRNHYAGKSPVLERNGINRISMGVQSMKDSLLLKLGRIHNRRRFGKVTRFCGRPVLPTFPSIS